jgi:hypothetical protein
MPGLSVNLYSLSLSTLLGFDIIELGVMGLEDITFQCRMAIRRLRVIFGSPIPVHLPALLSP